MDEPTCIDRLIFEAVTDFCAAYRSSKLAFVCLVDAGTMSAPLERGISLHSLLKVLDQEDVSLVPQREFSSVQFSSVQFSSVKTQTQHIIKREETKQPDQKQSIK